MKQQKRKEHHDEIVADMKAVRENISLSFLKDGRSSLFFLRMGISLNEDQVWQLIVKNGLRVKFLLILRLFLFVVVIIDPQQSKNTFTSTTAAPAIRHVNHN
jgi:hypothetical protein